MKKKTKQWLKEIENSVNLLGKRMTAIEKMVHIKSEAHETHEGLSSMDRRRSRGKRKNRPT